jgi:hypothetical protein
LLLSSSANVIYFIYDSHQIIKKTFYFYSYNLSEPTGFDFGWQELFGILTFYIFAKSAMSVFDDSERN